MYLLQQLLAFATPALPCVQADKYKKDGQTRQAMVSQSKARPSTGRAGAAGGSVRGGARRGAAGGSRGTAGRAPPAGDDAMNQTWTNGINDASKIALLAWERRTGIKLVQVNGQRRYGGPPPGWVGGPPPADTEVYIGKLPQDVYENTLIPLFESVGKLYEFRLMMTFSGLNRGFAYARYSSQQEAKKAISTLHHFQVREGCAIVVCWSTQKHELVVDGLAASVSQQELEAMLQMATEGVLSVTLYSSPCQSQAKLAVLKYRSHEAAALAKKALMHGNLLPGEAGIRVNWLYPQMKQKLQLWEEEPSSSWEHGDRSLAVPRPAALPPPPQNVMEHLNNLCLRHRLGTLPFVTKCVQVHPNGWQLFWYQVMIPGYPVPISGFTWVSPDGQGQSEYEKAKAAVALHLLQVLGCQLT